MHLKPNNYLYAIVFSACACLPNDQIICLGRKLFHDMPNEYRNDIVVMTSVISMFMAFRDAPTAEQVFSEMKYNNSHTYTIMMKGYKMNEEPEKCLSLFQQVKRQRMTIEESMRLFLIAACSQIGMVGTADSFVREMSNSNFTLKGKTALTDVWTCTISAIVRSVSNLIADRVNVGIFRELNNYSNQSLNLI